MPYFVEMCVSKGAEGLKSYQEVLDSVNSVLTRNQHLLTKMKNYQDKVNIMNSKRESQDINEFLQELKDRVELKREK